MARIPFTVRVTRARQTYSASDLRFSTHDWWEMGDALTKVIKRRIFDAKTIDDTDAAPLTEKYKKNKARVTPFLVRNLRYSGDMMRHMQVVKVDQNSATIWFSYELMARRMAFNMRRSQQWGLSPHDNAELTKIVMNKLRDRLRISRPQSMAA